MSRSSHACVARFEPFPSDVLSALKFFEDLGGSFEMSESELVVALPDKDSAQGIEQLVLHGQMLRDLIQFFGDT